MQRADGKSSELFGIFKNEWLQIPFASGHSACHSSSVTDDYVESFLRADRTFLYQLVFDPLSRKLVPLTPVPEDLQSEDLIYAGMLMADEDAFQLALGNLDCNTMKV